MAEKDEIRSYVFITCHHGHSLLINFVSRYGYY